METILKAIEVAGSIDENRQLHLDEPLPVGGREHVRVIILIPEKAGHHDADWLRAAVTNPVFDFLKDPEEEVYTPADGKPFCDQE